MTYTLYTGNYTYSSWSLRGWLLLDRFGLPYDTVYVDFAKAGVAEQVQALAPARTVPTLVAPDGAVISDSLAMAEELAQRHPGIAFWPRDPVDRAMARTLAAEMHASFGALREHCPMNLGVSYADTPVDTALRADLDRLEVIWAHALGHSGGPWLLGDYSVADAFFAPVATRIATYNLPMSDAAMVYVARHLADPAFLRWRKTGRDLAEFLPWYARDYPTRPWPGPDA